MGFLQPVDIDLLVRTVSVMRPVTVAGETLAAVFEEALVGGAAADHGEQQIGIHAFHSGQLLYKVLRRRQVEPGAGRVDGLLGQRRLLRPRILAPVQSPGECEVHHLVHV